MPSSLYMTPQRSAPWRSALWAHAQCVMHSSRNVVIHVVLGPGPSDSSWSRGPSKKYDARPLSATFPLLARLNDIEATVEIYLLRAYHGH